MYAKHVLESSLVGCQFESEFYVKYVFKSPKSILFSAEMLLCIVNVAIHMI